MNNIIQQFEKNISIELEKILYIRKEDFSKLIFEQVNSKLKQKFAQPENNILSDY
ncbi:hypothetical protein JCM15060_17620 [Halanaerobaculum tunisiense]